MPGSGRSRTVIWVRRRNSQRFQREKHVRDGTRPGPANRFAKLGAFLLAFGGTRTFQRLACAIEDAGWEIRDWLRSARGGNSLEIRKRKMKTNTANGTHEKTMIPSTPAANVVSTCWCSRTRARTGSPPDHRFHGTVRIS